VTTDLAGQAVVGTMISSPWFSGTYEVTQGWGQTDYGGEPEGHGVLHWHAGVDIGLPCGTVISLPAGLSGTAKALDNPGGYGTALIVQLDSGIDVLLGHNRQRLVTDGEVLRPGMQLTVSNNTGNSTGCHLHFEVRPHGGRYGTDVDPSAVLLDGTAASIPGSSSAVLAGSDPNVNPYNPVDPRSIAWELQHGITQVGGVLVNSGQVALGGVMLLGGLLITGYGLRGKSAGQLAGDTGALLSRRPRMARRRPAPPPVTGAERTRVRTTLQRRLPPEPAPRALPRARQLALPPGRGPDPLLRS
jgi:hypothetical protein